MNLKNKIKALQPIIGTWNTSSSPIITSAIAGSGLDFQIIDFEHGPANFNNIHVFVSAAKIFNSSILVRIPSIEPWMAQQALDQGADGIIFTSINCFDDASKAKSMCLYPPKGTRGFSPYTYSNNFNNTQNKNFTKRANDSTVCAMIVESLEGISNLESIISTKPDVIYFGAYDLSKELGFPGDIFNPKLISLIKDASKKALHSKIICGSFVPHDIKGLKFCLKNNLNFITYFLNLKE